MRCMKKSVDPPPEIPWPVVIQALSDPSVLRQILMAVLAEWNRGCGKKKRKDKGR